MHAGELIVYLTYVRALHFFDNPDYDYLWGLFHSFMRNNGWKTDWMFDWDTKNLLVGVAVQIKYS